jgi:hypothetical protein
MVTLLKAACLIIYPLGIAASLGLLPASLSFLSTVALVLLAAHALEAVVMFKHVKRYPGPLWVSIVLTLLFGLLHWQPLSRLKPEV